MTPAANILVIDDDTGVSEFVMAASEAMGLRCIAEADAARLPELLNEQTSLILLDLMMPGMDGIEALRLLGELHCTASIVLMSGMNERVIETAEKLASALDLSIAGHLRKPFRLAELETFLRGHLPNHRAAIDPTSQDVPIDEQELRGAIEKNEFILHYQPQVEIGSGRLVGFEALVRWQHPTRGLIFPDCFIGRLEGLGLIDNLGWLVIDRALSEICQLGNQGFELPRLALNVSMESLRNLKFPDKLAAYLDRYGVKAERIVVEITETGLMQEISRTLDVLTRLRVKNFQLSIDDFGTGYAVMQQLRNVPATELKIDRSFVQNLLTNASDRVMVQKITEIGHELGMTVLAEGVENREHLEFLRAKGCDHAQGYFFSRPLPPAQLHEWMQAYHRRA